MITVDVGLPLCTAGIEGSEVNPVEAGLSQNFVIERALLLLEVYFVSVALWE